MDEGNYGPEGTFDQSFHITIVNIPPGTSETLIDKDLVTQDLPNTGVMVVVHADLTRGSNNGPESIAYDPINATDGYFYFLKEANRIHAFRVKVDDSVSGAVEADVVNIPGLSGEETPEVDNISDVFFTEVAGSGGNTKRLMLLSADSEKVISADVDDTDPDDLSAAILDDAQSNPLEIDLTEPKFEALTFTPDGFLMFVVSDEENGFAVRRYQQYRNFTVFDPNAAPDLHIDSDTGVCVDDVTTATQLTFEGTLTRDGGAAVADAYVFLYVQIDQTGAYSQTGTAVETDVNGKYSVTSSTDLALGTHNFRIRVGENSNTPDAKKSLESNSESLAVEIKTNTGSEDVADLTGDCYIDFDDLTILLSHWAEDDPYPTVGEGNIIDPLTTSINFQDFTYLLAKWTGPSAVDDPQKALAKPSQDYTDTIYSTSTEFYVQFDAAVTGVDASDLELSGSGAGGASVGAPTDRGYNVWRFPLSGLSAGVVDVDLAPDEDDITYATGGEWIGLKEWSFTVSAPAAAVYALSA